MAVTYQMFLYDSFPLILLTFIFYCVKGYTVFCMYTFYKNFPIHLILTTQNMAGNVLSVF